MANPWELDWSEGEDRPRPAAPASSSASEPRRPWEQDWSDYGGPNEGEAIGRGAAAGLAFNFDDEIYGFFGGDIDEYRRRSAQAQEDHGGWYTTGNIASAFVPGFGVLKGVGLGARVLGAGARLIPGANAVARGAASLGRGIASVPGAKFLGGLAAPLRYLGAATAAGAGYGTAARLGAEEGATLQERSASGLSAGGLATDAVIGTVLGAGGGLALGAVGRALETRAIQNSARKAFDDAYQSSKARREAHAADGPLSSDNVNAADADNAQRMANDINVRAGSAAPMQEMARELFGIDLTRSQSIPRDQQWWPDDRWLADAFDGNRGPEAQRLAREIIGRQHNQTPQAFMRVVGDADNAPSSAMNGAEIFHDDMLKLEAGDKAAESAAWAALLPYNNVELMTSPKGRNIGLATMRSSVDDVAERFELAPPPALPPNPTPDALARHEIASATVADARQSLPVATKLYTRLQNAFRLATLDRGAPYTLGDLVVLKERANQHWSEANAASASPTDRVAVAQLRGAMVDWIDNLSRNLKDKVGKANILRPGTKALRNAIQDRLPGDGGLAANPEDGIKRLGEAAFASRQYLSFFGGRGGDGTHVAQGARAGIPRTVTGHTSEMVSPRATDDKAISTLIGVKDVRPVDGAHLTVKAIRERFGADSEAFRNLQFTVLRRFADMIGAAKNSDNPAVFNTISTQLGHLLTRKHEFVSELFNESQIQTLRKLHAVIRQMQAPGRGRGNATSSGNVVMKGLQELSRRTGAEHLSAGKAAAIDMSIGARPEVWGPTIKSLLLGIVAGPRSLAQTAGVGAMTAAGIDSGTQDDQYAY